MIPKRIVFFGSSSIHGCGDTEMGGFVHRFRLWHESTSAKHFVYELGIFGESTDALIARVRTETAARKPHLIVLYPGFNDIRREGNAASTSVSSLDTFKTALHTLISEAASIAPVLVMSGFPFDERRTSPIGDTDSYFLKKDAERFTQVLRSVCGALEAPILDYFALWATADLDLLLAEDGLHANPAGHQLLFEQLRDYIVATYR